MQVHTPSMEEILDQLRHGNEDRRRLLFISTGSMTAVATLAVILRLIARRVNRSRFRSDDYTILVALILAYGLFANGVLGTHFGLGRHAAVVGFDKVQQHLLAQFVFIFVYIICITIIKISILLFYRRIFDTDRFKTVSFAVGTFAIAYCVTFCLADIFQCSPVQHSWNKEISGTCISAPAILLTGSILNIITNIVIVVMPFPVVWSLQVTRKQKIELSFIFLLGSFVCLASIIRVPYLLGMTSSGDPTWYSTNAAIWTVIEVCLGIVCACLFVIRPLFVNHGSDSRHQSGPKQSSPLQSSQTASWPLQPHLGTGGIVVGGISGFAPTEGSAPYDGLNASSTRGCVTWTTVTADVSHNNNDHAAPQQHRCPWEKNIP